MVSTIKTALTALAAVADTPAAGQDHKAVVALDKARVFENVANSYGRTCQTYVVGTLLMQEKRINLKHLCENSLLVFQQ